ncbi:Uncharacterized protein OS=Pedosphaera parvula (strain Ellin514) GN=Cflav_PD1343 PE=4 SV=1 [Gemmataceae bacterium]|jgi:hypothetical protein|nr:Uncharacterized protein OS=Pedosphaera parvula (strain Ellin514) GN=Cflav_PD1343 PE=4 SV=1 [Gemmataceae bacterium]VTT99386.1 Uncharacterized protein OS=Pedosphaera parvula (strain Ellin514) GN=Cflav_PD1343 PE=4 SV=1 [Gemmataceae bacterium]
MCCFSGKVESVSDTNIFARASRDGRQFLVYSMKFKAGDDLAMILPIPTPKDSAEDAVKFINLEKYETFFDDLNAAFPAPASDAPTRGGKGDKPLAVVEVGKYVASFVPSVKAFDKLDQQFRLPAAVWDKLPQYADFGFAVFKLKKPEKGEQKVHPMAFEFPRDDKKILFLPTLHIHDGTVPAKAKFDHALFCQVPEAPSGWEESPGLADTSVKVKETQGIVDPNGHIYRKVMRGVFENKDVGILS